MIAPLPKAVRDALRKFAAMGGDARARKLSKARIKEIATMGGKARAAKRGNGS